MEDLASRTRVAYASFTAGDHAAARQGYEAILDDYPNDGVARATLEKLDDHDNEYKM